MCSYERLNFWVMFNVKKILRDLPQTTSGHIPSHAPIQIPTELSRHAMSILNACQCMSNLALSWGLHSPPCPTSQDLPKVRTPNHRYQTHAKTCKNRETVPQRTPNWSYDLSWLRVTHQRHASIGIQIAAPKTTQQKRNGQKRYERRRMIQDAMNQKKSASTPDQTKYPPTSVFSAITTLLTLKRKLPKTCRIDCKSLFYELPHCFKESIGSHLYFVLKQVLSKTFEPTKISCSTWLISHHATMSQVNKICGTKSPCVKCINVDSSLRLLNCCIFVASFKFWSSPSRSWTLLDFFPLSTSTHLCGLPHLLCRWHSLDIETLGHRPGVFVHLASRFQDSSSFAAELCRPFQIDIAYIVTWVLHLKWQITSIFRHV